MGNALAEVDAANPELGGKSTELGVVVNVLCRGVPGLLYSPKSYILRLGLIRDPSLRAKFNAVGTSFRRIVAWRARKPSILTPRDPSVRYSLGQST